MISREDFDGLKEWTKKQGYWLDLTEIGQFLQAYEDEHEIVSRGSCGECEHGDLYGVGEDVVIVCNKSGIENYTSFFCADFKRLTNE